MLPTYDELPIDPKYPPKTAWGVWGIGDNYGTINLLTPERIAKASTCIRQGTTFPLNWKLEQPNPGLFGRKLIQHEFKCGELGNTSFWDDTYHEFNTQASSQWDGLRHFPHCPSGLFYNGLESYTIAKGLNELTGRLGIHHVARRGIVGRAVLLDYGQWAMKHKSDYHPFDRDEITVQELDQVAHAQGVVFEEGDILLLRTGWMEAYEKQHRAWTDTPPAAAGVLPCEDTFRWLWNHHFAAVACDNFSFEVYPVQDWNTSCRK
ncbi:putative cyclase-domain-containing protein [Gilbertella persicaria]|uniref:putative cyclase-domain-containing protein n=1 Tax=Gilbertella persicaria TaxID=101096 RepID=UPI00221FC264|nr:putative cyclase-domain-containing protein [Gilbertella persicaria]KAI8087868.1 putative cyclase-domain-containing protein [Gilbertella persicaria]